MNSPDGLSPTILDAAVAMLGRAGSLGAVRVLGDSMRPTLASGDSLAVDFSPAKLALGDLILFRQADYLTVHRVLGRARFPDGRPCMRTRGDGVIALDPPVAPDSVVGRVIAMRREGKWRRLDRRIPRLYARAVAMHDLGWAAVAVLASRSVDRVVPRRLAASPGRRLATVLDRALLRLADRALFDRIHPDSPPPRGVREDGGEPEARASVTIPRLLY